MDEKKIERLKSQASKQTDHEACQGVASKAVALSKRRLCSSVCEALVVYRKANPSAALVTDENGSVYDVTPETPALVLDSSRIALA